MKPKPIKMPALTDTMQTGHLISWQKQIGDAVKKGDVLAEIESDKAIMDLEAFNDGFLAGPLATVDTDIPVGTVIAYLVDSKDKAGQTISNDKAPDQAVSPAVPAHLADSSLADALEPAVKTKQDQQQIESTLPYDDILAPDLPPDLPSDITSESSRKSHEGSKISPYAKGIAQELGLDVSKITAGADGAIHSRDVLNAALHEFIAEPTPDLNAGPPFHYKLLTGMHRAIVENMNATLHTPSFQLSAELPVAPLQKVAKTQGLSLTLLLARAAALAITKHPKFNMVYTQSGLAVRERIDVGIAVDVPGGLVTPVIRDVAESSLEKLSKKWQSLKARAKQQRLLASDYQGATFYISNLGMFPAVRSFDAIVPLGAAAILAIGAVDSSKPKSQAKAIFTLNCDHRVVYGADAARFMETLEKLLSDPGKWLD